MPTTTGTQNLTIPASTDNVEDQWLYHAAMAKQMEQRFSSHDDDAARLTPRPLTIVDNTVSNTFTIAAVNQFDRMVKFDTVIVDTADLADLETSPWGLTPVETGMYHFKVYVKILPSGCTGPGYVNATVGARGTGSIAIIGAGISSTEIALTGNTSVNWAGEIVVSSLGSTFGHILISFTGSSCAPTYTTVYARLGLYKVRDL